MRSARHDARPLETVVQASVLAALREAGAWAVNIHGDPMQPKTIDIIACVPVQDDLLGLVGLTLGVECKRVGEAKKMGSHRLVSDDLLQEYELQAIRDAGGWAAVVDDPAVVRDALAVWPHVCRFCLSMEGECDCDSNRSGGIQSSLEGEC